MLANLNDVLYPAKKHHYAVGLFNAVNLELARGIISAAESTGSPVIMGTAEVLLPYGPLEEVSYYLLPMAKKANVPVVIHLDHGLRKETCIQALELGFSSIMYDCSTDSYEDNVKKVKEMADIAHSYGATIEGELGHVGQAADADDDNLDLYTNPDQALDFVTRTGVDALAVAIGTAHGAYPKGKIPKLDFERLHLLKDTLKMPLVLHGGSGSGEENLKKAVAGGINKINVCTDAWQAAKDATLSALRVDPEMDYMHLCMAAEAGIKEFVKDYMKVIGSSGRYIYGKAVSRSSE